MDPRDRSERTSFWVFLIMSVALVFAVIVQRAWWTSSAQHQEAFIAATAEHVGHTVIAVGTLVGVEVNPGLPIFTGRYAVPLPEGEGRAAREVRLRGPDDWGFKSANDANLPQHSAFEICLLDDQVLQSGSEGKLTRTTADQLDEARSSADRATQLATIATWVIPSYVIGAAVTLGALWPGFRRASAVARLMRRRPGPPSPPAGFAPGPMPGVAPWTHPTPTPGIPTGPPPGMPPRR